MRRTPVFLAAVPLLAVLLVGCDGDDESTEQPTDRLVLTRDDGSTAELPTLSAVCSEPPETEEVTLVVTSLLDPDEPMPSFHFEAAAAQLAGRHEVDLPLDSRESAEYLRVDVRDGENSATSIATDASGTVSAELEACEVGAVAHLELDATLGSSAFGDDAEPVQVAGSVDVTVVTEEEARSGE